MPERHEIGYICPAMVKNPTVRYRHRQIGWPKTLLLGSIILFLLVRSILNGAFTLPTAGLILGLFGLLLAAPSMTVLVTSGFLEHYFGFGALRNRIPLREIQSTEVTRMPLLGWGMRHTPEGLLWRVSGTRGLAIKLVDGQRFFVGTNDVDELQAAISQAKEASGSPLPVKR